MSEELKKGMDHEDIIEYCVQNNPVEFNFNKAMEEASEFLEALLKYQTKHPDNENRPKREHILKEYGDFVYRGVIAVRSLFKDLTSEQVDDKIEAHITKKLDKLIEWQKDNKYKGGL